MKPDASPAPRTLAEDAAEIEAILPRIARRLFQLDHAHPASNLPVAQLKVCSILLHGPRPMNCISAELGISLSATTQIADRLERAGLVMRESEPDDRRVRLLALTEVGKEIMETRRAFRLNGAMQVLGRMTPEVRRSVLEAMERLMAACRETGDA
ncbi:MAG: MarR family transcriptional regulator [Armatimonadetes bacterium]|nr:MarR family transcriptional regulator [Armatimonadota bacterium]MDE2206146.1 MarR family transcriptional regulator [Armatimonadota bacterium]